MAWLQFAVTVEQARAEQWADALLEAGAASVQAEDEDADSLDEQPVFGEPGEPAPAFGWKRTRLTILADPAALPGDDPAALLDEAGRALGWEAPPTGPVERIEDQDWVSATQSQFTPIPVGRQLLVTPSWRIDDGGDGGDGDDDHDDSRDDDHDDRSHDDRSHGDKSPGSESPGSESPGDDRAGRIRLIVDPGLAFGTGSHPTTRLCLEWLDAALGDPSAWPDRAPSLIDYGCGSGILAIGAALLGAGNLRATDIDPQAVASTRYNAGRNGVVVDAGLPDEIDLRPADIVVANILSNPLKLLAPMLGSLVAPGGSLVLSGVLERQVDEVAAAYAGRIELSCWRSLEGWACLVGRRPQA